MRFSPIPTPHEIIDAKGVRQGYYLNKAAASRALNSARADFNRPDTTYQPGSDPNTWTLRPAKESK